jgi:acetylornithine deacetylase
VNTVTEEESTGAGGLVSARTISADAAIVPEPSGLTVWIACRGSLLPTITVEGRAGHAGIAPRHPDEGGPVNAIEKTVYLVDALRRLREEWALRPRHPHLSPPDIVPTMIKGGECSSATPPAAGSTATWSTSRNRPTPTAGDETVEAEIEGWVAGAAAADPWLREHPPAIEWLVGGVPPAEVSEAEPVVQALLEPSATSAATLASAVSTTGTTAPR